MRRLTLIAAAVIAAALPHTSALGAAGSVGIFPTPDASSCTILDSHGVMHLAVVHTGSTGTMGSRFAAPLPECWPGVTYLYDFVQFFSVGDSQSGIEVFYQACKTEVVHVLTIVVIAAGETQGCCAYAVQPHPDAVSGGVESIDCGGEDQPAAAGTGIVSTNPAYCPCGFYPPVPIENPTPPDSANGVPTNAHLSWTPDSVSDAVYKVHFDIDPYPPMPLVADGLTEATFDPGPLQPNTTYYWWVGGCAPYLQCTYSPIWTFTTAAPVSTERRTWGAIKELFRTE